MVNSCKAFGAAAAVVLMVGGAIWGQIPGAPRPVLRRPVAALRQQGDCGHCRRLQEGHLLGEATY